MNHESYIKRTQDKIERALTLYAPYIFQTVGTADCVLAMQTGEHLRKPPAKEQMQPIQPGESWGGEWGNLWLHTSFTVPATLEGQQLCVIPDVNAVEILCFKNGVPVGLINSKNKFLGGDHCTMFLDPSAVAGTTMELDFECYAGHECLGCWPWEYFEQDSFPPEEYIHKYEGIRFVVMDKILRDFVFDTATVVQLSKLKDNNFAAMTAYHCLMEAFPHFIQDVRDATIEQLRESALKVSQILAPALQKTVGERTRGKVTLIGHSHMDTAWLWPVEETIRKCARTYSQALTLMEMYPYYNFIQSSSLHLDWMRQYYPDIFEGIKKRVAEGRYEPNGGVWVECDCNITGGEAMVRQFLYGQRYTMEHLNYKSDTFWLPDTFGYSAAIPQIMKGFDIKYFCTTKMDWCDLNKFPPHSFVWRGMDGTEVLSHLNRHAFLPDVTGIVETISELRDTRACDMRLGAYGFGDGGGGPTYGMLEYVKRVTDLDGIPHAKTGTVSGFMQELEAKQPDLPVYDGELYLELHRGTLTQMHEVKRNNRKAEIALHELELMNVLSGEGIWTQRDDLYKTLLKNQFHDILPGTCIAWVYATAIPEMYDMIARTKGQTQKYLESLSCSEEGVLSLFNPLSFDRSDVVSVDGAIGIEGLDSQVYVDMEGKEKTAFQAVIPATGAVTLRMTQPAAGQSAFRVAGNRLTTPFYLVEFDENGYISSLVDLEADRAVHREGGHPLGTLWMGECMPREWDNWDIDDDIFSKLNPVTALLDSEVVSDGAVEYRIRNRYRLSKSSIATVDVVFYAASRRIDYEMKVDWNERHALLKAGFDLNIRSATVKSEIQFGHIDRPTTRNNSIEAAKFEICNHKWSDLSETRYGIALLNDCKYGLSVEGGHMRLTLMKAGCRPDFVTENGIHVMTYSLLPHTGGFNAESVIRPAYELNNPPLVASGRLSAPALFSLSHPGVICETVKMAEDVENAYVLRLYEAERNSANCTLSLPNAKGAWVTNMLEDKQEELELTDGQVKLRFRPFEIKTILVERA